MSSIADAPQTAIRDSQQYALTESVVFRMTGFPVEAIDALASPELAELADRFCVNREHARTKLHDALVSNARLTRTSRRKVKKYLAHSTGSPRLVEAPLSDDPELHELITRTAKIEADLNTLYEREVDRARQLLYRFVVSEPFQHVLVLSSPGLRQFTPSDATPPAARNSKIRQREFTWISYLQRLTTKNETISFFGPSAWGRFDPKESAPAVIQLSDKLISERVVYIERWVCENLAQIMAADPEVPPLLPLVLPDDLLIQGRHATLLFSGQTAVLSETELDFLQSCNTSPRYSCESPLASDLMSRHLLVQEIKVPISPLPFSSLQRIVASWPSHPAKTRWEKHLADIDSACKAIECATNLEEKTSSIRSITDLLAGLGMDTHRGKAQELYACRLPINEDCHLDAPTLILGKPIMEQLLNDAAPWFDLWRDIAGLYATRLHESIRRSWLAKGGQLLPLPVFGAEMMKAWISLQGIEEEIQAAWSRQLGQRARERLVLLTEEDTAVLRNTFTFRRMKAFDNMAPDLQIVANGAESLRDGNWNVLIAEIHPDFTTWQNCFFKWCPNPAAYAADYTREGGQGCAVVVGRFPPHISSAHTALWVYPYAHHWNFVGIPAPEGYRTIRSADTLVKVTDDDILLLQTDGTVLGSGLHTWNTALNTHRLELNGNLSHSPRLQIGRVIVQRESWNFECDAAFREAIKAGGSSSFAALRQFRQKYGLPEKVFLRGALSNRLIFDKDVKPVFLDFRNPLLTEMACKVLSRFQRFSVTEMLPATEECWLQGPRGHYSSEFRTVVMASKDSRNA